MPRKRKGVIGESIEELRQLERRYRGKPEAARIQMLILLKENPDLAIEDAALLIDYSKQALKRWLKIYRDSGLTNLLSLGHGGKRQSNLDERLVLLKKKLTAGEFATLDDVVGWAAAYTRSGPELVDHRNHVANGRSKHSPLIRNLQAQPSARTPVPDYVVQFLSQLPVTHDIEAWISAVRTGLRELLGDVDRISIGLNAQCDLLNPEKYKPGTIVLQNVETGKKIVGHVKRKTDTEENVHLERMRAGLRRAGFSFDDYHVPQTYVYYYAKRAYLGFIVLWRERSKPPISEYTLRVMDRLHDFMVFLLSDFVVRHRYARPINYTFNDALQALMDTVELTTQERRVVILQTLGFTYEEMADTLNISTNTVRYHLRSIYSKTGTHSQAELFAKYFTPRFDPNKANE